VHLPALTKKLVLNKKFKSVDLPVLYGPIIDITKGLVSSPSSTLFNISLTVSSWNLLFSPSMNSNSQPFLTNYTKESRYSSLLKVLPISKFSYYSIS